MTIRRFLVAATTLALASPVIAIGTARPAFACSCLARSDVEQLADSDAVFTGTVKDVEFGARNPDDPGTPVTWTFAVDRVYKGRVSRTQVVVTELSSAACGLGKRPGKRPMLVFASRLRGHAGYSTSLCSGDRPLSDGPVPAEFGAGAQPRPERS